jgi:hypothetical protein
LPQRRGQRRALLRRMTREDEVSGGWQHFRVLLTFDLGVAQLTNDALPSGWSAVEPQIAAIPPGAVAVPSKFPRHRRAFDVAGGIEYRAPLARHRRNSGPSRAGASLVFLVLFGIRRCN